MHAHEQGGEADKGGYRGAGIRAPGARHVGEHVVVRALEGDAPLFVVAIFSFWDPITVYKYRGMSGWACRERERPKITISPPTLIHSKVA